MDAIALGAPVIDDGIRAVNFFNGRLLTGRDLSREQEARRLADRRIGETAGPGIAWGLEVSKTSGSNGQVTVEAGLALSRSGLALRLAGRCELTLVQPPDVASASTGSGFAPCGQLSGSTYVAGGGVFLLTLAPISQAEGQAPVLALEAANTRCSTDAFVEALQFRLLRINGYTATGTDTAAEARLRSEIAYAAFAQPATNNAHAQPGQLPAPGLVETLRSQGLSDCDVPLAVVYMVGQAVRFVDRWSVRRRLAADPANTVWSAWLGERRLAEAEAQLAQFQDQIAETPALLAGAAQSSLHWLPAAGFLPGSTAWPTFLGVHAPVRETRLAAGDAPGVLARALADDPVALGSATRLRVYRIGTGSTAPLLFVRDRRNAEHAEQVWLDGTRAGLGSSVADVQAAIDTLRAGTCLHQVFQPGMNLAAAFAALPAGGNLTLCFEAGSYEVNDTLVLSGRGRVQVHGHGATVTNTRGECALRIDRCQSADVHDIGLAGARAGSGKDELGIGLHGALTVVDTPQVRIERVRARCAGAPKPSVAAIVVGAADPAADSADDPQVLVADCELTVGSGQLGLLVLNAGTAHLLRNLVAAPKGGESLLRGIVVAGGQAGFVRIEGNVVRDVVRGIAVGLSEPAERRAAPLLAGRVLIDANRIELQLAKANTSSGRYGIFVGNAESARVSGNHVKLVSGDARSLAVHAVRLSGAYGAQVIGCDNLFDGTYVGIVFQPEAESDGLRVFQNNVGQRLVTSVLDLTQAKGTVVDENNILAA